MTDEQRFGALLLLCIVVAIAYRDWRWLLAPITFTLIFVYLLGWTFKPRESARGRPQHGPDRFRRGKEA